MPSNFYKHMPTEDGSVYTGELSLRVKPGADIHRIVSTLQSQCRIPEHAVLNSMASRPQNAELAREADIRSREITFHFVWQRVGHDVSLFRRNITQTLLHMVGDSVEEIISLNVLTEAEVTAREEKLRTEREREQLPHLRVVA